MVLDKNYALVGFWKQINLNNLCFPGRDGSFEIARIFATGVKEATTDIPGEMNHFKSKIKKNQNFLLWVN